MAAENNRVLELLRAWSGRRITPAEEQELADLIGEEDHEDTVQEHVRELVDQHKAGELLPAVDWELVFENIKAKKKNNPEELPLAPVRRIFPWRGWAVAAAIIGIIAAIAVIISSDRLHRTRRTDLAANTDVNAPTTNRASIILSDGRTVALDSLNSGLLALQGRVELVKLADGRIAYRTASGEVITEMQYNTLNNPRGSKVIDMVLSDGSHVWLNAGSSVTYPVAFIGKDRKVAITGEAYFEVAHDVQKPFYVTKGDIEVKVLGTHFNVNAYDDENDIKVTLLEGSVRVGRIRGKGSNDDADEIRGSVMLRPGQQAVAPSPDRLTSSKAEKDSRIVIKNEIDLDAVVAWKNGLFQFNYTPIDAVLKQLGRWYDIDVVYEDGVPDIKLWGEMKRDLTLNQALRGLGKIGVHFRVEGTKLIVMKKRGNQPLKE